MPGEPREAFRAVAGPASGRVAACTGTMEALAVLTPIHRLWRRTARLVLDAQPPGPRAAPAAAGPLAAP